MAATDADSVGQTLLPPAPSGVCRRLTLCEAALIKYRDVGSVEEALPAVVGASAGPAVHWRGGGDALQQDARGAVKGVHVAVGVRSA